MTNPTRFSLILPFRNQADHVGRVLEKYLSSMDRLGAAYELVVVPNACSDETPQIVAGIARRDPRIRLVENPRGGWGRSVLAGLHAATGQVLSYTNSARTDPERLPELYQRYLRRPNCLVKVCRVKRKAPVREIGSFLYNLEARLFFGIRCGDVNGTPKIFSREFFEEAGVRSEDDLLDMELMARAAALGLAVVEVPLAGFRRHGGRSSTTWGSAWRMYSGAWRLHQRMSSRAA